jgi:hypothetical protein
VRHDFFHDFRFILIFPFCPQLFSSGTMQNSQLGKTAPRDKLIPNPKARLSCRSPAWASAVPSTPSDRIWAQFIFKQPRRRAPQSAAQIAAEA